MLVSQGRIWVLAGGLAVAATAVSIPDLGIGGPVLTLDLGLRVENDTNHALSAATKLPRRGAQLRFGLGLVSETEVSKLSFQASGALAAYGGRGARTGNGRGLVTPALDLDYERAVADADLRFGLSLSESDLSSLDPAASDFSAAGSRRTGTVEGALNWGKTAPLGFGLTAAHEDARYSDAPGQPDRRTDRLGTTVRARLSEVLSASLSLGTKSFRRDGLAERRTNSATLAFTLQRPTSQLELTLGHEDAPEGNRLRLALGQTLELPRDQLGWRLGAVRDSQGRVRPMVSLDWQRALPDGALGVSLSRDVSSSDTDDRETLQNRLAVNYSKQITQTGGLQLSASWSESRYSDTGTKLTGSTVSAVWRQELTPDWGLDLGYVHRSRHTSLAPSTRSDRVYLELHRSFVMQF